MTPPLHRTIDGHGPRLVLVHGFTQTSRCWEPIGAELAADHEVVRIDAPGHGRSHHDTADLWEAADLLAETGGAGTWLGYSMGGRMALHVALAHPGLVDRLVLVGATPGIRDDGERTRRRTADHDLADHVEQVGVEAFVDEWLAQPLFAGLTAQAACREARLTNRPEGLAGSLRRCGTGAQEPLWDRLVELAMPVDWCAGAHDTKFCAIGDEAAAACPRGRFESVPGAGHTAHLEAPDAFLAAFRQAQADR